MAERTEERIAVIGLGYVGLPVALGFAGAYPGTVGFDIHAEKVRQLQNGVDQTGELTEDELKSSTLKFTSDPKDLQGTTFFVVAVPTPIDRNHQPDLVPLMKASETVGRALQPGAVVVYESTVYPGVTEEICGPILERCSGLRQGVDFKLGYSPERINPGDKEHTLSRITKVVSGEDSETLERVATAYGRIVDAGVHRASSIKVAEAAKVIENTQRDLNIALMNELALIFDRMGIPTRDVLAAAGTKWNFLRFTPGLVGGHCIGVDPYYLTAKAEEMGYHPQVILAGRRINDGMGTFIAQKLVKLLVGAGFPVRGARVGVLGLTFKENVPDLRNSRVPDIIQELEQFQIHPLVHDPLADPHIAQEEYGLELSPWDQLSQLDGLIYAVGHAAFQKKPVEEILSLLKPNGVLMDVKAMLDPAQVPAGIQYWCL
jgi:UDP-N-acetyl-D-galactosamine dehydrogenase